MFHFFDSLLYSSVEKSYQKKSKTANRTLDRHMPPFAFGLTTPFCMFHIPCSGNEWGWLESLSAPLSVTIFYRKRLFTDGGGWDSLVCFCFTFHFRFPHAESTFFPTGVGCMFPVCQKRFCWVPVAMVWDGAFCRPKKEVSQCKFELRRTIFPQCEIELRSVYAGKAIT